MSLLRFFLVLVVQESLLFKTNAISCDICRARRKTTLVNFFFYLFMLLGSIDALSLHPWCVIDVIWTKTNTCPQVMSIDRLLSWLEDRLKFQDIDDLHSLSVTHVFLRLCWSEIWVLFENLLQTLIKDFHSVYLNIWLRWKRFFLLGASSFLHPLFFALSWCY